MMNGWLGLGGGLGWFLVVCCVVIGLWMTYLVRHDADRQTPERRTALHPVIDPVAIVRILFLEMRNKYG